MNKLVESQSDENQVNENELENLYGGESGGECDKCTVRFGCICDEKWGFADEEDQENVVF